MCRRHIYAATALTLGLALGGCGSFDPIDKFQDWDLLGGSKKPLQGERRAVFPEGTPGVPQGVPPEMMKGYQPPAEPTAEVVEEKPKPQPQKRAKVEPAKPRPPRQAARPAQQQPQQQQQDPAQQPWSAPPQQQTQSAWPDPPQQQTQQAWPAPAPARTPAQSQQPTNSSGWPTMPGSQPTSPNNALPAPTR